MALRRERPPEEYRRVLATVGEQAASLRRIVEALLFLARADAEGDLPGRETLDLASWVPRRLEGRTDRPRSADVRFVDLGSGPAIVSAPPALLSQVIGNLVENAEKYSDPGSPILVGLERRDSRVVLSVEDRGRGIRPEDLPRIFDPFFRAAPNRRNDPGVGLGLSVARRIAEALGGSLSAQSRPGQGSRFDLRLPAAPGGDEAPRIP